MRTCIAAPPVGAATPAVTDGSNATLRPWLPRLAAAIALLLLSPAWSASADDLAGRGHVLPAGTEIDGESLFQPREIFRSEAAGGIKSYAVKLGDMAFNAPGILGGPARKAGISCGTCHVNGTTQPTLFIPGMSTRPGNFDTTGPFFNPAADNGVLDPVTIPSLRGARYLAPYGHDGRSASLRDFVRNVIVNEFAGPEPSPSLLDAIVAYIEDIDFLPNRRLGPDGQLAGPVSDSERRGQSLFFRPFAHDPQLSCAACHVPSGAFADHRQHDVGSGGLFKTPTLLNANFNGPYFHDGRYGTYAEVVVHFDRIFYLGLSAQDRQDLVAYLNAIGDGEQPYERDSVDLRMAEIDEFVSILDRAIPEHDAAVIALTIDTVDRELRALTGQFLSQSAATPPEGKAKQDAARTALLDLMLNVHPIVEAAEANAFDAAAAALANYWVRSAEALPLVKAAEPWSLLNPAIHDAHIATLAQLRRQEASAMQKRDRQDHD